MWDADQYQRYSDERSRPFFDLVGRIGSSDPRTVVDLGCGPGTLTATLAERWPDATVTGIDNDPAMLAKARSQAVGRVAFSAGDIGGWRAETPVDVIVTNAALQWVPDHRGAVMERLVASLAPGGWLALQVPGNLHGPHHDAIAQLATSPEWASLLGTRFRRVDDTGDPVDYADRLDRLGCSVDAWETTYLHILPGSDPVLEWVKGTALRPALTALESDPALQARFCDQLAPMLRAAYPPRRYGTPFPFRRVFAVARRVD